MPQCGISTKKHENDFNGSQKLTATLNLFWLEFFVAFLNTHKYFYQRFFAKVIDFSLKRPSETP